MATKITSIPIDEEQLKVLNFYKERTGVPISRAVKEALADFIEAVMPARLEAFGVSQNEKKSVKAAPKKRLAS